MIKGLLIDLDGVLIDSTRAYMAATNVALKNFNHINVNEDEVKNISLEIARRLDLGFSKDKFFDDLIPVSPKLTERFLEVWLNTWNEACLWDVDPISGVHEVLTYFSDHFPLALITLRHIKKSLIEDQLNRLKFNNFFKVIITALDVKKPKPNPDSLFEGSRRLGVQIKDCAIIGDSITDIRAGKASGTKTIAVLTGIFDENTLKNEKPDLIVNNITEIPLYLK